MKKRQRNNHSRSSSRRSDIISIRSKPETSKILSLLSKVKAIENGVSVTSNGEVGLLLKKPAVNKDTMLLNDPRRVTMAHISESANEESPERNEILKQNLELSNSKKFTEDNNDGSYKIKRRAKRMLDSNSKSGSNKKEAGRSKKMVHKNNRRDSGSRSASKYKNDH